MSGYSRPLSLAETVEATPRNFQIFRRSTDPNKQAADFSHWRRLSRRRLLAGARDSVAAGLLFCVTMLGSGRKLLSLQRQMHTLTRNGPSETLKRKVAELEKLRRKRSFKKNQLFVEVPESKSYLDTATMPMIVVAVGGALFAKLLMMYDDSKSQEMIERKIQHAPVGQGTVRMLSREEWEEIQEVRPRTPFESKLARPNARIRTGEPLHMEDLKDWTTDVLTDALTRAEETAKHSSK